MANPLPPELWIPIIGFATSTTGVLDFSARDPQSENLHSWDFSYLGGSLTNVNTYQGAIDLKLTLAATCKLWRRFIIPFLYEHIRISTLDQWRCLARTLNLRVETFDPSRSPEGEQRSYGWYTRRLDIIDFPLRWLPLPFGNVPEHIGSTEHIDILRSALKPLTHLEVLTVKDVRGGRSEFVSPEPSGIIGQFCTGSVRHFSWSMSRIASSPKMYHFGEIEVLELDVDRADHLFTNLSHPFSRFPRLHTLVLSGLVDSLVITAGWSMPALRRLIINVWMLVEIRDLEHIVFLRNLTDLQLTLSSSGNPDISTYINSCPLLQNIILPTPTTFKFLDLIEHPSLIRISFPVDATLRSSDFAQSSLENAVKDILRIRIPSLRRVRLEGLDAELFADHFHYREQVPRWIDLIKEYHSRGVRLEYENGELVEVPGSYVRMAGIEDD
jgi:hypothetical protein